MNDNAHPLTIGVSTRALFNLEEEHQIFVENGVEAYAKLQREREAIPLKEGTAFEAIRRLLALNVDSNLVEVILLSRNSPDLSLRAFHSIEEYQLKIQHGSFTSGRPLTPFIKAWGIDLFLSNNEDDVRAVAKAAGAAAAKLASPPGRLPEVTENEVRFAFDGDAVLFGPESDKIYTEKGLDAFLTYERENATAPMTPGPFGNFLRKLAELRDKTTDPSGLSPVRIALVTSRNAPAHARAVHTFREWGTPADEAHFVGRHAKGPILEAIGVHIYFDDQEHHVVNAGGLVASGLVPGPHRRDEVIIPAAE